MAGVKESIHGEWSGRWAFILAATGSAVGLGNIWKFPYIAGENGGGAFVLIYLICIAVIGVPIMMAEIMLGRRGKKSPMNTMNDLAIEAGHSTRWEYLGWMGVLAGFLILSYYSVIAGWAMDYVFESLLGNYDDATPGEVGKLFGKLVSDPIQLIAWHSLFMLMTMMIVARGVEAGLEKAVRLLMPALFILLLILVGYAMNAGDFSRAVDFLFRPDFSKLSANGVMIAMGHAFFTLSLGMGAIMMYGSYLKREVSITKTAFVIAGADTLVALLAGLAIFPLVFANNLEPGSGPGLIFQTLPLAFGHMPGGLFFGTLFFLLLTFAAWTSSISLIEPAVAWLIENHAMTRRKASIILGLGCWAMGLLTVFSFNIWSKFTPLAFISIFEGKTIFDLLDYLTANIMLPVGGFFIAVFAVWFMTREASRDELNLDDKLGYRVWRFLVQFVTPVAVALVFANLVGLIKFG